MIRVGIIGTSFGYKVHLPAFQRDGRCRVTGFAGRDAAKTEKLANEAGVGTVWPDWKSLVRDSRVDLVSIAVPPIQQREIILECVSRKKPFFCEKPLGFSADSGADLVKKAGAVALPAMINFEFLEVDVWRRAADAVRSGALGKILSADLSWMTEIYANRMNLIDSWKVDPSNGGGVIGTHLSHSFYYLENFFGPCSNLTARTLDGERVAHLLMEMESGALINVSISSKSPAAGGHRMEVSGTEGRLTLSSVSEDYMKDFSLHIQNRNDKEFMHLASELNAGVAGDGRIPATASVIRRLIDWIETGFPETPSIAEGVRVDRLIDAARSSAEQGVAVSVSTVS